MSVQGHVREVLVDLGYDGAEVPKGWAKKAAVELKRRHGEVAGISTYYNARHLLKKQRGQKPAVEIRVVEHNAEVARMTASKIRAFP